MAIRYPLLTLAFSFSAVISASAVSSLDYATLEHVDSTYLANVSGLGSGHIGFVNFAGTSGTAVPYMITLFFDLDSALATSTVTGTTTVGGNDTSIVQTQSNFSGGFGMYIYNIATRSQEFVSYFTSSANGGEGQVEFIETHLGNGLYTDSLNASDGEFSFLYEDNNSTSGADTTALINTANGDTLGEAGFPFSSSAAGNAYQFIFTNGPVPLPNGMNQIQGTGIQSVGVIPEPSAALLLGAAGILMVSKRRRMTVA
jgi:hypothetical protein